MHARWALDEHAPRWRVEDATLVFADVAGFTAMSEKLARSGKIGAEEATGVVNRIFEALLRASLDQGGEILKFGGDAALAYFAGDGHALRGAHAALAMQRAMRDLRRVRTAAGVVTLRLSAGIASGPAHLFLAGSGPSELLIAGPLAGEVVALETVASGGEVVAGDGTCSALPAGCVGAARAPGHLLGRALPAAPVVPAAPPPGVVARELLAPHLHDHEPGDGEHRPAAVGFLQVRGVDRMLEREGPEALAVALDTVIDAVSAACADHGVTFVSTDVDRDAVKAVLVAGAPAASGDDADRLLHALRAVVRTPLPLPVRAGANHGRVFVADIGTDERRVWTVMGDTVNLAARVMVRAGTRQVLASSALLECTRDAFTRTPVEPFAAKGKAELVHADVVGPVSGARRRARADNVQPLVGRDRELAILGEALDAAREGRHRIVEIVADAGIGKSRLVDAALEIAHGLVRFEVDGGPYSAHSPYFAARAPLCALLGAQPDDRSGAVEARLRARVADLDPRLEPWLPLIGIPFGLEIEPTDETRALSPAFARERMHAVVGRLVELLLDSRPVLLLVEDAHWLDHASGELLRYLAAHDRTVGSCYVVTRRPARTGMTLGDRPGATLIELAPLDGAAAGALIARAVEDAPLPPGVSEKLVERAGGNPLLLSELLAAARAGAGVDALPDSVEALVNARIDTLSARDRQLLRQAAVLGLQVPVPLLAGLLDLDDDEAGTALARLDGFLVDEGHGVLRFRHALLREAAYEALPFRRRRELHARAAALIEQRAGGAAEHEAEILAIHYHAAHRWPETWRHAVRAGEQAFARSAPDEAADFYARALEAGRAMRRDHRELAELSARQGTALRLAGRFEDASRSLAVARRYAAGDALLGARLCLDIGRLRERSRHQAQALRWYTMGMRRLEPCEGREADSVRAQLLFSRAVVRLHGGHMVDGVRCAERAAEIAMRAGDRRSLAKAYTILHWAHTEMASELRVRYRDMALPIFEEFEDYEWCGKTLNNLGIDAYWSGRWDEAVDFYERGRAMLERVGDVVEAGVLLNNIAEIRSDQGRLDEAEAHLREVLPTFRGAGFGLGVGLVLSNLGRVASRRGDVIAAAELFGQAREALGALGADAMLHELDTREAERLVRAGDPDGALRLAGSIRATAEERRLQPALLALNQRVAAQAKLVLGDLEGARVRLHESVEIARSVGAVYEEARSLEALGGLGGPGARDAAAAAAALLGDLGARPASDGTGERRPAARAG